MRLKIFSCHHLRPVDPVETELFCTMTSDVPRQPGDRFLSDLDGLNIAEKGGHCELRQQYFVWKNLLTDYDYVGFEHYSRLFFIDPYPAERVRLQYARVWATREQVFTNTALWTTSVSSAAFQEYSLMRREMDARAILDIKKWVNAYDFIITPPHQENIRVTWEKHHAKEVWGPMVTAFKNHSYFRNRQCFVNEDIISNYYLNMYIMRSEYFDEYMSFCYDILDHLESIFPEPPQRRLWGHVSERLFSMYMYQKRMENSLLQVAVLPYLRADTTIADTVSQSSPMLQT